jgi:hypothetical protein
LQQEADMIPGLGIFGSVGNLHVAPKHDHAFPIIVGADFIDLSFDAQANLPKPRRAGTSRHSPSGVVRRRSHVEIEKPGYRPCRWLN